MHRRSSTEDHRSASLTTYVAVISLFVITALGVAAGFWRYRSPVARDTQTRAVSINVRSLPRQGAEEGPIELLVRCPRLHRAALLVLDITGKLVLPALRLDTVAGDGTLRRAVISRRGLNLYGSAVKGRLIVGGSDAVERLLAETRKGVLPQLERASQLGLSVQDVTLLETRDPASFDRARVAHSERLNREGQPARALSELEALLPGASSRDAPWVHALASEAAFALGRVALARAHAERGLGLTPSDPALEARLLRALLVAEADGGLAESQSPARERLRRLASARPDPREAVLDAATDLRFGLVHDRAYAPPLVPEFAQRLLVLAETLDEAQLGPVAHMVCEAAGRVWRKDPRAQRLLAAAARSAERDGYVAARGYCSFVLGDVARREGRLPESEAHYVHALAQLGDHQLPREQREAWYSAALSAAARGDMKLAFERAQRAAHWVEQLLALETDLAARESLLINTASYHAHAVAFGVAAGDEISAIAVAEASKGRAVRALLRGVGEVEESAVGAFLSAPLPPTSADDGALRSLASRLAPDDALLSYTIVRPLERETLDLVIGVVTRERVRAFVVHTPASFRPDVLAFEQAVARNDGAAARELGGRLYRTLLSPLEGELVGKTRLLLSAHLRLHTLPWAALHDGERWLVERFAVARVPALMSEATQAEECSRSTERTWLLALDPAHAGRERLPGFAALAPQLSARLQPGRTLVGAQVTPAALRAGLRDATAMLYAGHATYDGERPFRSALLLASSSQGGDEGWAALDLIKLARCLDVIVLLGCETARVYGAAHAFSDEAVGLSRAFLAGGARHVVGSLWPIVDRDAEDFARALTARPLGGDVVREVQQAQTCLATGGCPNRGVAAWASYVVDSRVTAARAAAESEKVSAVR